MEYLISPMGMFERKVVHNTLKEKTLTPSKRDKCKRVKSLSVKTYIYTIIPVGNLKKLASCTFSFTVLVYN